MTVACGLSHELQNSRIHLGGLTHNSRIRSSRMASLARARSALVSVTTDCCASVPRSFAFVAAADAMRDACVTGRSRGSRVHALNSGCAGGLLPVCKSTSYSLLGCEGPRWRMRSKGRVYGPAEDLRPVSEAEAGVNLRPAGGVRGQVAGSLPGRQPGTGTRRQRFGVVTPALHLEVPDTRFASPGPGKGIRQLTGWTKVCQTAQSGIWVLKGNARTRMLPANLDHLRLKWRKQGSYETAWVTPGKNCLCPYKYGHGAAVRPQTSNAIWDGNIGLWSRVAPLLSPWCARENVPTGVNLNQYAGTGSQIRWHSDKEPLFGPQYSPKLMVSLSLANSVEFQVRRRAPCKVPYSIRLDHGDILVMDGLAQSEYEHCTASGLHCSRVNLTFRWIAQHTASCPLAGVVGCVLPMCVQGLVEPSSRWFVEGETKWSSCWGCCPVGQHLDSHQEGASSQWSASIPLGGALLLLGSCLLGRETALATVTTSPISQKSVFLFLFFCNLFLGKTSLFFKEYSFLLFFYC